MFLDIAAGLISATTVGLFLGIESGKITLLLFGVLASLSPDIDYLIWVIKKEWMNQPPPGYLDHEHRDLLHYPLLFVFVGLILLLFTASPKWALTWISATLFHFAHDTFQEGWGIKWLSPFSKKYFTLASYSPKKVISDKEEQRNFAEKYGNEDWLEDNYKKINRSLLIEISLFIAGLIISLTWLS